MSIYSGTFKKGQLDNYCLYIASMHFNSIEDYINLELAVKHVQGNMTKFFYNPIPITNKTLKFFPNIRTFHFYKPTDEFIENSKFIQYNIFYTMSYQKSLMMKRNHRNCKMNFKHIIYTKEDRNIEYKKGHDEWYDETFGKMKYLNEQDYQSMMEFASHSHFSHDFEIPEGVHEIQSECFSWYNDLCSITLPKSLTKICEKCFAGNMKLEEIVFPQNVKILENDVLRDCICLNKVQFPQNINSVPRRTLWANCALKEIVGPNHWKFEGDRIFYVNGNKFESIFVPSNVKFVNKKRIVFKELNEIKLPDGVKELGEYCFAGCSQMTNIIGMEKVNTIGKGCFHNCDKLFKNRYYPVMNLISLAKQIPLTNNEMKFIRNMTGMKVKSVLFDDAIDDFIDKPNLVVQRITGKRNLLFLSIYGESQSISQRVKCGGFISSKIDKIGKFIPDSKACCFVMKGNEIYRKYQIQPKWRSKAFIVYPQNYSRIMNFGFNDFGWSSQYDPRDDNTGNYSSNQMCYNYSSAVNKKKLKEPLNPYFKCNGIELEHLLIIQLE